MKVSIFRYNPESDDVPYLQDYDFKPPGERDLMVLDVLELLKQQDSTLTFRRSCREGVCGSDGMNINGANSLACITRVSSVIQGGELPSGQPLAPSDSLTIRPLPGMPVIRDLVVDMELFWKQYRSVKPWLINTDSPPTQERLQSPEERARLDGLYECILCGCCTSACPSWWWNPETYVGPAGLLASFRFLADSRDTGTEERLEHFNDRYRLYRCRSVLNCVSFCPKKLNPRSAISQIQHMMLKE